MGIHNLKKNIRTTYPKSCREKWLNSYDNLYIDLNHVLHKICHVSTDLKQLIGNLCEYVRKIILKSSPKKRIILACDGMAPLAKLMLQRKRRIKMAKSENGIDMSINFTPGTKFMNGLKKSLKGFEKYLVEMHHLDVIFMIDDIDEGEIKIRRILQKIQNDNPDDTHVVYSGDSDMILLLFTCHNLDKIYHIIDNNTIIHMGNLYNGHVKKYGKSATAKYDFVFINILMGNDYIPKVYYLKLDKLWNAYKKLIGYYPNGLIIYDNCRISVDPIFFHDMIYYATRDSNQYMMNKFKLNDMKNGKYDNYIEGVYWCVGMYSTGICSDYQYIYEHDKPPHVLGLSLAIISNNEYKIRTSLHINSNLYSILLIPESEKELHDDHNIIIKKLKKKFPMIYEESKCDTCKKYSKLLSKLNKNRRSIDVDMKEEKIELNKKITDESREYTVHRKNHDELNLETVKKIEKYYNKITKNICGNQNIINMEDDLSDVVMYVPLSKKYLKKKLF